MSAITTEQPTAGEQTERLDALAHLNRRALGRCAHPQDPPPGQYLTLEDGEQIHLLALVQPVTHIGRGFHCEVHLDDHSVSRRHAIVTRRFNTTRILDDRSSNGTFVNGRRVTQQLLQDGDVIVLGRVVLGYLEVQGAGKATKSAEGVTSASRSIDLHAKRE